MSQTNTSFPQSQGRQNAPVHLTEIALRGLGQVYDIQLSAARVLLQTQARAASAIGLPDWSGLFHSVDDRARSVFASSAEQLMNTARRANDAAVELQKEFGRVVETQAATVADTLQQGFEEMGNQTEEGLNQLVENTRQQAGEAQRAASAIGEEIRSAAQRSSDEAREARRDMQSRGSDGGNQPGQEPGRPQELGGGAPLGEDKTKKPASRAAA